MGAGDARRRAALGGDALSAAEIDIAALGRDAAEYASPVVPLAERFPDTHAGATSQDILDTAMMLVAQRALSPLLLDAQAAADAAGGWLGGIGTRRCSD